MIFIFGRPVHNGDLYTSPVSRHVSGLAYWRDTLSHDTALIMSEIDVELPEDVIEAILGDPDVFYLIDLDPDPPEPGPESGDSGEKNPDKKLTEKGYANALYGLSRLGVPDNAINADMTFDMIANVFRERMLINQALGDLPPDAPLETARKIRGRLGNAGFDVSEETQQDIRDTINEAVKKGAVRRGNPNKR